MQWSVLLPVVLTLIATTESADSNFFMSVISDFCYAKWALEAFVISNAKRFFFTFTSPLLPFQMQLSQSSNSHFGFCDVQICWSLVNNSMWCTICPWLRSQQLVPMSNFPRGNGTSQSLCCIYLYDTPPEEMSTVLQLLHAFLLYKYKTTQNKTKKKDTEILDSQLLLQLVAFLVAREVNYVQRLPI